MSPSRLRIKNWDRFQHYRDRRPLWIKLYKELLDDIEWHKLDGDSAKTLVMLWLLASEAEGELPEVSEIAFRFRLPEKTIKSTITRLSHWLEQNASSPLADSEQVACLETEKRREEEEKETERASVPLAAPPTGLDAQAWGRWVEYRKAIKKPLKPVSVPAAMRELVGHGTNQAAVVEQSIANGWQGLFALKPKNTANGKAAAPPPKAPPTPEQIAAEHRKAAEANRRELAAKLGSVARRLTA